MKTVTFYRSRICPRCHLSGFWLSRLLPDFPDVAVEHVEFLTNRSRSRRDGVRGIPAFVAGSARLDGFLLTPKRIRRFLATL